MAGTRKGKPGDNTMAEWEHCCLRVDDSTEYKLFQIIWPETLSSRSRRPELWGRRLFSHNPMSESANIDSIQRFSPYYSWHCILKDFTVLEGGIVINKQENTNGCSLSQVHSRKPSLCKGDSERQLQGQRALLNQNLCQSARIQAKRRAWPAVGTIRETLFLMFTGNRFRLIRCQSAKHLVGLAWGWWVVRVRVWYPALLTFCSLCLCFNKFKARIENIP